ncbi:hypothetical protein RJT34_14604 [Clitoria ternatea]|uniref:Uncharacterized protein n=1 Tax=Clitoria ternatea TaxID=43366 RepID=A0AAN9JTF4_CLITE
METRKQEDETLVEKQNEMQMWQNVECRMSSWSHPFSLIFSHCNSTKNSHGRDKWNNREEGLENRMIVGDIEPLGGQMDMRVDVIFLTGILVQCRLHSPHRF